MKKILLTLIAVAPLLLQAQTSAKVANEAYVLTRMVNKFHVEPRDVNDAFSSDVFAQMLVRVDDEKLFFTKEDIAKLSAFNTTIDDEIKQKKTGYLDLFTAIYQQRLNQSDSLVDVICKKPFNFYISEKFTVAEDTSFPANISLMQAKLYKKLKLESLNAVVDDLPDNFKKLTLIQQKKYIDSAEAEVRKKIQPTFKRKINNILQNPYGMVQYVGNIYCEAIANCFDPHTEYFPKTAKENFESELGQQPFRFGFRMKEDKGGGVLIDNLQPGSPAFKSGKLNKGDKFIAIKWAGKQTVDVSDISANEFSRLIQESNHDTITFTIKKTDGSVVQVPLLKEQQAQADDDDDKVKSFVLKGATGTIGYIYLPAFYQDWEQNDNGINGCANDVAKEILKLKKENITGLIIDIRFNGGGSLQEGTELAGIFIDAGPVAQEKGKEAKVYTLKDVNRGTIYDGPMVLMVNGYSASASEMLAGTLQDYHRAVIVGSPTYGKATAQIVFPMDTTVTFETLAKKQTETYIKITVSKLYRVNGTTAQFKGVLPDIMLPDVLDADVLGADVTKEADEQFALRPTVIDANKYYQAAPLLPVASLAENLKQEIDTSSYFKKLTSFINYSKQQKAAKDISLTLADALNDDSTETEEGPGLRSSPSTKFTVLNNQYEISRLQADSYLKKLNDDFKEHVISDPYISIAFDVFAGLKK